MAARAEGERKMMFPLHDDPERLAAFFHATYETLAPRYSYTTRKASAVPWSKVPENNRRLMIEVARIVQVMLRDERERRDSYLHEYWKIIGAEEHEARRLKIARKLQSDALKLSFL
jgi:hypothetical protein